MQIKSNSSFRPEVLAPAGNMEKLKAAISYGADAVYLAGQKFGLRSAADNFTIDELFEASDFAKPFGAKLYLVLNSFPHESDLAMLPSFLEDIRDVGIHAVIASDLGMIRTVLEHSIIPVHLSTQASCLNVESGIFWKSVGVSRLILGREVTIEDAGKIKKATGLEVELFIHGSMCMAYSGNCTISNFTKGRDSNRGGCAQSCRFNYSLDGVSNQYFMSSKDLQGIDLIPEFFKHEIDSVKIEGRMRSALYAGVLSKVYKEAIQAYSKSGAFTEKQLQEWMRELSYVPHRDYFSGSLKSSADQESTLNKGKFDEEPHFEFIGAIKKVTEKDVLVEVKSGFKNNQCIEFVGFNDGIVQIDLNQHAGALRSSLGTKELVEAKSSSLVRLPNFNPEILKEGVLVRRVV